MWFYQITKGELGLCGLLEPVVLFLFLFFGLLSCIVLCVVINFCLILWLLFGFVWKELNQKQKEKMKYILVTGGVVSGLGKGVTASSIGLLLIACGLRVTSIKIGIFFFFLACFFLFTVIGCIWILNKKWDCFWYSGSLIQKKDWKDCDSWCFSCLIFNYQWSNYLLEWLMHTDTFYCQESNS